MTIINQNSISGITSITAASGSVQIFNSDGSSGSLTDLSGVNVVGVVTATSFVGDGSNLTGIDSIVTGNTSVQTVDTGSDGHIKFNTEGSEVARFDSSGRFGLGTTNPSQQKLTIDVNSSNTTAASFNGINVCNTDNTTNNGSVITFGQELAGNSSARIGAINTSHTNGSESQDIFFGTIGAGAYSERARIDSSGRLLVGATSAPTTPNGSLQFAVESPTTFTTSVFVSNANSVNGAYIALQHGRGGTADSDTIVQSGDDLGGIQFVGADGTTTRREAATIKGQVDGNPASGSVPGRLVFSTTASGDAAPTERMRIDSSGNVRIANASSSAPLTVRGGSATASTIHLEGGTNGVDNARISCNQSLSIACNNAGNNSGRVISFYNGTSTLATIDSSGRLLVGTTTASGFSDRLATFASTAGTSVEIRSGTTNYGQLAFSDSTAADANSYAGYIRYDHDINALRFGSSGTERMRITSDGLFKFSNTGAFGSIDGGAHGFRQGDAGDWCLEAVHAATSGNLYGVHSQFPDYAPNNTSSWFYLGSDSSANRVVLYSNGGIGNYQSNNVNLCDEREKKNIEALDSTWDCLKDWELKKFHYNEDADTDDKRYGVIAQQVAPHCPEVITEWVKQKAEDAVLDEDGNVVTPAVEEVSRMAVKEQQMMWMAIKALQEAQTRIETLESANASQAATIAALDARLTALEGG